LTGFTRSNMGPDFYRGAPKLKLIQLISAGYDRLDIEAARQARVPVANNGGSNSVAVAEHTLMLILAVYKKLAWHHNNVVAGRWRGALRPSTCTCSTTTLSGSPRTPKTPSGSASRCSRSSCAPPTSSRCTCPSATRHAT